MSLGNAASPKLITHGSTLKALISPAVAFTRLDLPNPHFSHLLLFVTLWTVAHQALCPWDSSVKDT